MAKKYWLEIYGCQMNFAEGYALENELRNHGWEPAGSAEEADAAVLHTCSVRQTAENRIWGRLGYFKHIKQSRPQKLIVMGCMAERLKEKIREREPAVDLVVGNYGKEYLADIIERTAGGVPAQTAAGSDGRKTHDSADTMSAPANGRGFNFHRLHHRERDFHDYLPIMHGCNNFCTYCIVPYVRGREVSRPPEEIIREIRLLEAEGVKEISLLGQNVNSYSYRDSGRELDFPDILEIVLQETRGIEWVRFITSHPKDVPPKLIELIASEPKLCRHVHLPVQHGSSTVLKRMNRKYSREDYLQLVGKMRSAIPDISLTTDILIGFPGETEADLEDTISLMKEVRFDDAFMYYYNVREGTPAAEFEGQLPKQTKLDRLAAVIETQRVISREKRLERVGTVERVLAESASRKNAQELLGRTERDQMVVFPGDG
ncbi:MAG: tRNA (N6-isopentenyl adenosine(37)-C2)-methylthiotransferase MiaB, partial [Spirochaetota bacterium]|nr:tRNA (N6-isopentenyl adenosine(37)-C2)-methylthiotransferase MiaB [Spirochaetota bacterium]